MRYFDEAIGARGEYIQEPFAATDVNQTTLCVYKQVVGVAAGFNSLRHLVAKVEGGEPRWMSKQ